MYFVIVSLSFPGTSMAFNIQVQASTSGLLFADRDRAPTPQWRVQEWPPLLGGWRCNHAAVVLDDSESVEEEHIVVLGGNRVDGYSNKVLLLNTHEAYRAWRPAPSMNERRSLHAAVVCNGSVYAIGGHNGFSHLKSIEKIDIADLLDTNSTGGTTTSQWTTLVDCSLSSARMGCVAQVVDNRYIVVAGGMNGRYLSAVDIIDTVEETVLPGPPLNIARAYAGVSTIGNRIHVIGGYTGSGMGSTSIEYLDFNSSLKEDEAPQFSSPWTMMNELALAVPKYHHGVASVGSCMVVAGGYTRSSGSSSAEVLDTVQNTSWNLPHMKVARDGCRMVSISQGLVVIGGRLVDTCEAISLVSQEQQLKVDFHV